jgi:hypothetical protein
VTGATGVTGTGFVSARAHSTSTTAYAAGSQQVPLNVVDNDPGGNFTLPNFIAPATGQYLCLGMVQGTSSATNQTLEARVLVAGGGVNYLGNGAISSAASQLIWSTIGVIVSANAGQTIGLYVNATAGIAPRTTAGAGANYFCVIQVS